MPTTLSVVIRVTDLSISERRTTPRHWRAREHGHRAEGQEQFSP
jgi:hypothetical protein